MFNFEDVEVQDFNAVPAGDYPAIVEKGEYKLSKAGAEYLNLQFKITGDSHAGRIVFNIYNLFHPNEQVRNIAMGEVKQMLMAMNATNFKFATKEQLLAALLGKPVTVKLAIKKDLEHGDKNIIKGYSKVAVNNSVTESQIPF